MDNINPLDVTVAYVSENKDYCGIRLMVSYASHADTERASMFSGVS